MRPPGPGVAGGPRTACSRAVILWDADNCRPPRTIPPAALVSALKTAVDGVACRHLDLPVPPPTVVALFANAALGDLAAWKDAGVSTVLSLPCRPGAADQAIAAAAVDFVRGASEAAPSLLTLVSADGDFAGLLSWASAQEGLDTLVIGDFHNRPTAGPDGWRRLSKLVGAADAALHWSEVVDAAGRH